MLGSKAWIVGVSVGVVIAGVAAWRALRPADEDPGDRHDAGRDNAAAARRRLSRRPSTGPGSAATTATTATAADGTMTAGGPAQLPHLAAQHEEEDSTDDGVVGAPAVADTARFTTTHEVTIPRVLEDREPDVLLTTAGHAAEDVTGTFDANTAQVGDCVGTRV